MLSKATFIVVSDFLTRRRGRRSLDTHEDQVHDNGKGKADDCKGVHPPALDSATSPIKIGTPDAIPLLPGVQPHPLFNDSFRVEGYSDEYWAYPSEMADQPAPAWLLPKLFKRKRTWNGWRPFMEYSLSLLAMAVVIMVPFLCVFKFGMNYTDTSDIDGFKIPQCQPLGYLNSSPWTFVGIDVRFQKMSYSGAKACDLVWNWIAGRGLQLLLGLLAYRVITTTLVRLTEVTHLPYHLFASLAFYSTKPDAIYHLIKGLRLRGWRVKFNLAWLIVSITYLALFPSLMDIVSGYEASYRTIINLPNGTTLDVRMYSTFEGALWYRNVTREIYRDGSHEYEYTEITRIWFDPILNASWARQDDYYNGRFYLEDQDHTSCEIDQGLYQWGFSGEWVILIICFNSVFVFGLWVLWLDSEANSELCCKNRRMGIWRGIADISEAMRKDLGTDLCAYPDNELSEAVGRLGPVKYCVSRRQEESVAHISLSSRRSGKVRLHWDQVYGRDELGNECAMARKRGTELPQRTLSSRLYVSDNNENDVPI